MDSSVAGWLDATANIFCFLVVTLFLKFKDHSPLFRYPFDITLFVMVFLIGNILFAVFYAEWIAYSVHWIIFFLPKNAIVAEMLSRLYLCHPSGFNTVTAITGFLKTGALLSGAVLGPIFFVIHHTLPFMVAVALSAVVIVLMGTVYCYRLRLLSAMEFDEEIKGHYLLMERAYLMRNASVDVKVEEEAMVKEVRWTLKRGITSMDVLSLVE